MNILEQAAAVVDAVELSESGKRLIQIECGWRDFLAACPSLYANASPQELDRAHTTFTVGWYWGAEEQR